MRRLVIVDSLTADWLPAAQAVEGGGEWDVLVLRHGADSFRDAFSRELMELGRCRILAIDQFASSANDSVRQHVLEFIATLPDLDLDGVTPLQLLGPGWWHLGITEKSPFRSLHIDRLYWIALSTGAIASHPYDEIWLATVDAALTDALANIRSQGGVVGKALNSTRRRRSKCGDYIRYWGWAGIHVFRALSARHAARRAGLPRRPVNMNQFCKFSMYPLFWRDPFGAMKDRFFSDEELDDTVVAWITDPRSVRRCSDAIAALPAGRRPIALQYWLRISDITHLIRPRRFLSRRELGERSRGRIPTHLLGVPVGSLWEDELQRGLMGPEQFLGELLFRSLSRFIDAVPLDHLAYRIEFQPWENALLAAISGRAKSIGFFHSPFGENYLPMQFAPDEMAAYVARSRGSLERPVPDTMLTCSNLGTRYLTHEDYPAARIAQCGPQRFGELISFLNTRVGRAELRCRLNFPADETIIFIALANMEEETEAIFHAVSSVVSSLDNCRFIIKPHPNHPSGDAPTVKALRVLGERAVLLPPISNMYEYLAAADLLLTGGSTIAFEAMALGVFPIVYEHPGKFAATSLEAFEDGLIVVRSTEQFQAALNLVLSSGPEIQNYRAAWPRIIEDVLGNLSLPLRKQLLDSLRQLGVVPGKAGGVNTPILRETTVGDHRV